MPCWRPRNWFDIFLATITCMDVWVLRPMALSGMENRHAAWLCTASCQRIGPPKNIPPVSASVYMYVYKVIIVVILIIIIARDKRHSPAVRKHNLAASASKTGRWGYWSNDPSEIYARSEVDESHPHGDARLWWEWSTDLDQFLHWAFLLCMKDVKLWPSLEPTLKISETYETYIEKPDLRRTLRLFRGLRVLVQACLLAVWGEQVAAGTWCGLLCSSDLHDEKWGLRHIIYIILYYKNTSTGQLQLKKVGLKTQFPSSTDSVVFAKYRLAWSFLKHEVIHFCPRCAGPWYFLQSSWSWAPWWWETCRLVEFPASALIIHPCWFLWIQEGQSQRARVNFKIWIMIIM